MFASAPAPQREVVQKDSVRVTAQQAQQKFARWVAAESAKVVEWKVLRPVEAAEMGHDPARTHAMIDALLARVASGELTVVTDRVFRLAEAADAHRYIESRQAFGRVLLAP